MTLHWSDGMDRYGVVADADLNYSRSGSTPAYSASGGVNNGGYLQISGASPVITRTISAALTSGGEVHVCFWLKNSTRSGSTTNAFLKLGTNVISSIGANPPSLTINTAGTIAATMHNAATVLGTSPVGVIASTAVWYHIEYRARWNTVGGYVQVRVNGNLVIDFAGATASGTVPTTWNAVSFLYNVNDGQVFRYDDLIIWDEVGTDFVRTQISSSYLPIIEVRPVDGDDSVQFTPGPESNLNFNNIADPAFHDGDVSYNASSTVGHVDQFTVADPATVPAEVMALVIKTIAKLDTPAIVNLRSRVISGGVTSESADHALTTAYQTFFDPFGKDPATSAAWAPAAPAGAKIGYEYQS